MRAVELEVSETDGRARAGVLLTPRGRVEVPCFMPVGTRGVVKTLAPAEVQDLGAEIVLANTYHLAARPGLEVVAALGGIHGFAGWSLPVLTDSGGYQVFSLSPAVDEDGVTFKSVYDGSPMRFTPESAVRAQEMIGSDIQMVLDVCPPLPSPAEVVEEATRRTIMWARRAREAHAKTDQAIFAIVQGGVDLALRGRCVEELLPLDFDGYAIGGLSVGEKTSETLKVVEAVAEMLPADRPRYLMGVGDPLTVIEAVAAGVDMFDCVFPTRLARHGTALTSRGRLNLKRAEFAGDGGPIEEDCSCPTCARHSRAFIRHLLVVGEPLAARLVTIHNLEWMIRLMREVRRAVLAGRLEEMRLAIASIWGERSRSDQLGRLQNRTEPNTRGQR